MIGRVTGREVKKNLDGIADKLILQVEVTGPEDIQSVEMLGLSGEECNPEDGSIVLISQITDAWKVAIAVDDGIVPSLNPGEKKIYSTNAGVVQAVINLLSSGVIELNGNAGNAVKFAELEAGFVQLRTDLNNFMSIFVSHVHPGVTSGGSSTFPTTSTPSSSSASISSAEVTEVKLP